MSEDVADAYTGSGKKEGNGRKTMLEGVHTQKQMSSLLASIDGTTVPGCLCAFVEALYFMSGGHSCVVLYCFLVPVCAKESFCTTV